MTDQASPQIKQAEDVFKSLAWDTLVTTGLDELNLDFWPINVIIRFFTTKLYEQLRLQFDLGAIAFLNAEHKAAFDKADVTLKIIASDKGIDSDDYKRAKENAKIALSKFERFGATT